MLSSMLLALEHLEHAPRDQETADDVDRGEDDGDEREDARELVLRCVVHQRECTDERDAGERPGLTSAERDRIKELEREVRELRVANEILKKASAYFAPAELDRPFRK